MKRVLFMVAVLAGVMSAQQASIPDQVNALSKKVTYPSYLGPSFKPGSNKPAGGTLILQNSGAQEIATMGPTATEDQGVLQLFEPATKKNMSLEATGLFFLADGGKIPIYLGKSTEGPPKLEFDDDRGNTTFFLGNTKANEHVMRILNNDQTIVFQAGSSGSGLGFLQVNGKSVGDIAESFHNSSTTSALPGSVMSAIGQGNQVKLSAAPYDNAVVGVVAGAGALHSAIFLGSTENDDLMIAMAGQVYVRVNGKGGDIKVGDLLVSSGVSGVAMRSRNRRKAEGAVIGKALETYDAHGPETEGLIRMLVMSK